ncbi:hypothetical protein NL108_008686 [Boleophthalmus pectinirostris]|nr:hypothetical protein NL108_008686 [Boleophthalmus pectinirostris]
MCRKKCCRLMFFGEEEANHRPGKRSTMPDSPADVKTQSRLTPPTMPPPPSTQGAPRNSSYTPTTLTNGSSHSPTALNGAPSPPNGYSNGPSSSSSSSLANQQLPPACGARQLSKLKRFLTTLQQFGNDISPEIGERVRTLVLGLVNSTLTIEEFHSKLQEATNFPLRPFVIPFLKANLPLLQRELLHCARLAKQNPAQYLAQHEQLLLDTSTTSPVDSSELRWTSTRTARGGHLTGKSLIAKMRFMGLVEEDMLVMLVKGSRTKENGFERDSTLHPDVHPSKRPCTISPAQRFSPSNGLSYQPNGLPHPGPLPPQHYRLDDMAIAHHYRDTYRHPASNHREIRERARPIGMHSGSRQEEVIDHRLTDREWAEEWKHLDHNLSKPAVSMCDLSSDPLCRQQLLNCIMDMVEKTRRSLTVLRRCQEADREELNYWIRRYSDAEELKKEILLHRPVSGGYVPEEIWKKAEEAVNEVKRQAMSELQKAVSEAERKAHEMISSERAKMERTVAEAKRQAAEDALSIINQQEDSSESCWNCGRKASETCSGCNTARYCGSFCQHKDWEKHHHVCGQTLQQQQAQQQQQQAGVPGADTPAPISSSACTPSSGTGSPATTPPAPTPRSTTPSTPSSSALDTTPR